MAAEAETLRDLIADEIRRCVIDEGERIAHPTAFARRVADRVLDRLSAAQIRVLPA